MLHSTVVAQDNLNACNSIFRYDRQLEQLCRQSLTRLTHWTLDLCLGVEKKVGMTIGK
jgi:hypothetical protein